MRLLICCFSLLFITACMSGEHQNPAPRVASARLASAGTAAATRAGSPVFWEVPTPVGPVPLELAEVYPVGCYVGV